MTTSATLEESKKEVHNMKLKPGPTRRVHANNTRGAAFCGMGAFVGIGKTQRAHVYTAASLPVGPDDYKKIDPERLARELEVDKCAVNSGRFWMMDEVDYAGGDSVDFHGVKMNWAGDMTGAEMMTQFQSAYVPSLDPAQHHLDLAQGQTRAPAARAGRPRLGPAGIHQGGRFEPDPRQPRHGGEQAEEPAARAGRSRPRCSPRTFRWTQAAPAAGPPSFATTCTAPTRAAATARTPAPTTCLDKESIDGGARAAPPCSRF